MLILKKVIFKLQKIVRYLKKTIYIGFIFNKKLNNYLFKNRPLYNLINYINSNFIKDSKDQKLLISYYFFLNRAVIF